MFLNLFFSDLTIYRVNDFNTAVTKNDSNIVTYFSEAIVRNVKEKYINYMT